MVTPTKFHRYNLDHLLPIVTRRVLAGDFASQAEIARYYGVDRDTAKHWRRRSVEMGLTTTIKWQRGIVLGRLSRIDANDTTLAAA